MFFLQVKESIVSGKIYAPSETAVLLAALSMQAKYGDYKELKHTHEIIESEQLLPARCVRTF